MKKKVLIAVLIPALLLAVSGAVALFSHTLQVGKFRFTAGAVEIEVDGDMTVVLDDIKPCYTGYVIFKIRNVGYNPVDLYKHIYDIVCYENLVTPAEKQWYDAHPDRLDDKGQKNDIHKWILYDLWVQVWVPTNGGEELLWWQGIYDETVSVAQVESRWIYLGMLPPGAYMIVEQSYHLRADTEDWAQTDIMDFNVEVQAQQLNGERTLENKDSTDDKYLILHDDVGGTLEYNVIGNDFTYTFEGTAPQAGTGYSLIYYLDPWGQSPQYIGIDAGTTDAAGHISLSGTIDIGPLPQVPDTNVPHGAKIWLVLTGDLDGTQMAAWNPDAYLFETGLIIHRE